MGRQGRGPAEHRLAMLASGLGILGGLFWLSLPFYPPECAPVTESSEIFCTRLWSPALGTMLIGAVALYLRLRSDAPGGARRGVLGVVVGFALMTVGNVGEYWFAYELPHQGGPGAAVRSALWMSALTGWLIALIGSVVVGIGLVRSRRRDRWIGLLFLAPLPLTVGIAIIGGPNLAPLPVGLLGIATGVYARRVAVDGAGAASGA